MFLYKLQGGVCQELGKILNFFIYPFPELQFRNTYPTIPTDLWSVVDIVYMQITCLITNVGNIVIYLAYLQYLYFARII